MTIDSPTLLPWIDMETSGLNENDPRAWVGEIGFAITDRSLNIVDSCSYVVVPDEKCILPDGTYWVEDEAIVRPMHTASGLFDALYAGEGVPMSVAADACLSMLADYIAPGTRPLCGSSLRHDRNWLARFAPNLHDYFHYRSIDVSSHKEVIARFWPEEVPDFDPPPKKLHRVEPDIIDSINEFRQYMAIIERGVTPFHAAEFQPEPKEG